MISKKDMALHVTGIAGCGLILYGAISGHCWLAAIGLVAFTGALGFAKH